MHPEVEDQRLLENLPHAVARHRLVTDAQGNPADYVFLRVNTAFEAMTGLSREDILGQKVSRVLPGLKDDAFDWVGAFGRVAQRGEEISFEQYSGPLQRWYSVQAYSDEPGYFVTVFSEITPQKQEQDSLKSLLALNQKLLAADAPTPDYQGITDNLQRLSGASFAALNTYEDGGTRSATRALAGLPKAIRRASRLLGFEAAGQTWEIMPERVRHIEGGKLTRFSSLYEASMGAVPRPTASLLQRVFNLGEAHVIELAYGGQEALGDLIFFMPRHQAIKNQDLLELYAGFLGAFLGRRQAERQLAETAAYYRSIVELLPDLVFIVNRQGLFVDIISSTPGLMHVSADELPGKRLEHTLPESVCGPVMQAVHRTLEEQSLQSLEYQLDVPAGRLWFEARLMPAGREHEVMALVRNITSAREARMAIQASEDKYRAIFDSARDALLISSAAGHILEANAAACRLYGYSREEFLGRPAQELTHPRYHRLFAAYADEIQRRGYFHTETRDLKRDGTSFPAEINITPISLDGLDCFLSIVRDVSERKQAEEELRASEEKLASILRNTRDMLWSVSWPDYEVLFVSPAARHIYGYTDEEFVQDPELWEKTIHPQDREIIKKNYDDLLNKGISNSEYRIIKKNGHVAWVRDTNYLIYDQEGSPRRRDGIISDITAHKDMEKHTAFLSSITANVFDSIVVTDNNFNIIYLNKKAEELFGYSLAELQGKTPEVFNAEADATEMQQELYAAAAEGRTFQGEALNRRRDGSIFTCEYRVMPLVEEDGAAYAYVGVQRDVTERRRAEEALHYRLAFERLLSRVSSSFLSLPPAQLDEGLAYALRATGEFFQADRSYLFLFSPDGRTMSNTHEWCREGVQSHRARLQDLPVQDFPWWFHSLSTREYVHIPDINELPPEAAAEKEEFQSQGIASLLSVPVRKKDRLMGFFGFDSLRQSAGWSQDQVVLLQILAELIASALLRHQDDALIRRLTFRDQLTGLYNRHYFANELQRLQLSREHPITVISADLEGLKLVNDTLGHGEGDLYLLAGARLLQDSLRGADVLSRVGGDEFAVLLPRTGREAGEAVLRRVYSRLEQYNSEPQRLPLSISLGLAVSESPEESLEETFNAADNLMYRDKLHRGKRARAKLVGAMLDLLHRENREDARDNETTRELCSRLGKAAELEEEALSDLLALVQLRDLGLLAAAPPGNDRPGRESGLTERERLQQQAERGYRIASASPELAEIARLIRHQHEYWDGSGYPAGLQGEAIPAECRILAIVDAFRYLAGKIPEHRTTRAAVEEELRRQAGSRLDPALTAAFLALLTDRDFQSPDAREPTSD